MKKVIDRGKRSKTLSEVKPVENISRNLQSFLEMSPVQKGKSFSNINCKTMHEYQNPFGLKKDNLTEKLPESNESSRSVSHSKNVRRV